MNFSLITRILVPFGLGYFLSYLFRVVNAVIANDVASDLNIDASTLGMLTSVYFATFAAFQLPLGVLLDRFGPRRVEAVLLLFAAAGSFVFSVAENVGGLLIGRALIGFGVSACLMAAFIAYRRWFEPERLPLINGLQMAFGGFGALAGTRPVAMLLEISDWRMLFSILCALGILIALVIWFIVPKDGDHVEARTLSHRGFRSIFSDRFFWRITPLVVFSQAAFLSIQGLWIGTWLRDIGGMTRLQASNIMALTTIAMVAGFLLLGWGTSKLGKMGVNTATTAAAGMGLFLLPQLGIVFGADISPVLLWTSFGFLGTAGIIGYAAISQHFPIALAGRANTAINFLVFVLAFAEQWGLGYLISLWPVENGYAEQGYRVAFGAALMLELAGLLWYLLFRSRRA